jgi:hypothetical protein
LAAALGGLIKPLASSSLFIFLFVGRFSQLLIAAAGDRGAALWGSSQAAWGGDLFTDLLISDLGVGELKKECIFSHDASSSSSSSAWLVLMEF